MILSANVIKIQVNGVDISPIKTNITTEMKWNRNPSIDFTVKWEVDKRNALTTFMTSDDEFTKELCCALLGKDYPFIDK